EKIGTDYGNVRRSGSVGPRLCVSPSSPLTRMTSLNYADKKRASCKTGLANFSVPEELDLQGFVKGMR
ncbi:hypothetical protein JYU34_001354, partial [Plutella xylostella]